MKSSILSHIVFFCVAVLLFFVPSTFVKIVIITVGIIFFPVSFVYLLVSSIFIDALFLGSSLVPLYTTISLASRVVHIIIRPFIRK